MNTNIKKQFLRTYLAAFTLLEILIVLSITAITSSILLIDFNSGRIDQELEASAREVASAFREAQNYALTGYQGVAGSKPCRFEISWIGATYTTTYYYKNAAGIVCDQSAVIHSYTLRNGITFSSSGNFFFKLPRADVSFAGASQAAVLSKAGFDYVVCTYQTGRIDQYSGASCP